MENVHELVSRIDRAVIRSMQDQGELRKGEGLREWKCKERGKRAEHGEISS